MTKTHYKGEFLTTEQLAERWGMEAATLEIWRQRKKGPNFVKLTDGKRPSIRYPIETIYAYEATHTIQAQTVKK